MKTVLAIETSCDETAAAVVELKDDHKIKIRSSIVSSQIDIHKEYGGVVPEVAARAHVEKIIPVVKEAMSLGKIKPDELDAVAVTQEPGLPPSLLVGQAAAEALALAWHKPLLRINHLYGHIYSAFIDDTPELPALALVISGGHTGIWLVNNFGEEKLLGQTLDDAVGEAFDKVAQLLNLPYPGGPEISKLAKEGDPRTYNFPRPMIDRDNLDFSFSGLKTAVRTTLFNTPSLRRRGLGVVCASFQQAVVDTLVIKMKQALLKYPVKSVILAGGVAASLAIRQGLKGICEEQEVKFYVPELKYCGDNAAMIGVAALLSPPAPWQGS